MRQNIRNYAPTLNVHLVSPIEVISEARCNVHNAQIMGE